MIDIHSHILPGIDDGAKDIDMSLEMLKIATNKGTKKIVATPHYYRGYYENKYDDICKLVDKVNNTAHENGIDIEIIAGQEVFLDGHTLELYKQGIIKAIGSTNYMLVELPISAMPKNALDVIYELKVQGIKPIIAHPERYVYIMEKVLRINDFIEEDCLFQINTGSIKGLFGKTVQKTAEVLIKNRVCDFIASDTHNTGRRAPGISDALELTKGLKLDLMESVLENAERLLNNEDIFSNAEKIKEKKTFFSFFKK